MKFENMFDHSNQSVLNYYITGMSKHYSKVPGNMQIFVILVVVTIATDIHFHMYYIFVIKLKQ